MPTKIGQTIPIIIIIIIIIVIWKLMYFIMVSICIYIDT